VRSTESAQRYPDEGSDNEHRMQDETVVSEFTHQAETFNASAVARAAHTRDELVVLADPKPSQRWFELACEPNVVSRRLAPRVREVHGRPDSHHGRARPPGDSPSRDTNARFEVGDATATRLATASVDGAIARFSIHHLPVPSRLFDELARVVRPGGAVVLGRPSCR
jgi:ubiquinone/menaquinone biosynthesis C-methylase UbiE